MRASTKLFFKLTRESGQIAVVDLTSATGVAGKKKALPRNAFSDWEQSLLLGGAALRIHLANVAMAITAAIAAGVGASLASGRGLVRHHADGFGGVALIASLRANFTLRLGRAALLRALLRLGVRRRGGFLRGRGTLGVCASCCEQAGHHDCENFTHYKFLIGNG